MTRALFGAALAVVVAAAAMAEAGGVLAEFTSGAIESPTPDHLNLWCNSPQATLTLDNSVHTGFAGMTASWHNLMTGAFVATPEGVVIGTSRDRSALKTTLSVQPREQQSWRLHPNVSGSYRFAVIGDTHNTQNGATTFGKLGKDMGGRGLQFAIHLGNAATRGNGSQLHLFREQLRSFPFPTYVIPGNEDLSDGGRKRWSKLFGEVPVSFAIAQDRFLLIDNAFGIVEKPTLAWLEKTLHKANEEHARHIFVFLHQPLVDTRPGLNQGMKNLDQVRTLLKMFQAHRVHTVFAGHIPLYARETRQGVYYVTTGGGGTKLAPSASGGSFYHYVRVEVNGDDVKSEPIRLGN
jgi:hypothetical protein